MGENQHDDENELFLSWLIAEGADISAVRWPTVETDSGIRGAVAERDIGNDK